MKKENPSWKSFLFKPRLPWKFKKLYLEYKGLYQAYKLFPEYLYYNFINFFKINQKNKPTIFVNFEKENTSNSRDLYTALNAFSMAGFNVNFFRKIRFKDYVGLDPYVRLIYSIENIKMVNKIPQESKDIVYMSDTNHKSDLKKKWKKTIDVEYDISLDCNTIKKPIFFPFPMHPLVYKLNLHENVNKLRETERKVRIFFAGAIYHKWYFELADSIKDILIRPEVIDTIIKDLNGNKILIKNKESFNTIFNNNYINKCVIIDTDDFKINIKNWLSTLSKSDFFLCPPGDWPMCHNIIEAMAVGTIPITNYANWLNPSLKDMENCITFNTKKDLIKKIKLVFEMDQEKIMQMKKNVISYYENYYNPLHFINSNILNEEDYIKMIIIAVGKKFYKSYLPKINKNSIIIQ